MGHLLVSQPFICTSCLPFHMYVLFIRIGCKLLKPGAILYSLAVPLRIQYNVCFLNELNWSFFLLPIPSTNIYLEFTAFCLCSHDQTTQKNTYLHGAFCSCPDLPFSRCLWPQPNHLPVWTKCVFLWTENVSIFAYFYTHVYPGHSFLSIRNRVSSKAVAILVPLSVTNSQRSFIQFKVFP